MNWIFLLDSKDSKKKRIRTTRMRAKSAEMKIKSRIIVRGVSAAMKILFLSGIFLLSLRKRMIARMIPKIKRISKKAI